METESPRRLELLLDVPMEITVELGRSRMTIQELLALSPGSVIELDKLAGEPLDILVNDRLIARGEAVVINDKFGIRITDIVSRAERIARLR
jgi:flagellar motor switch protein FliN/FliY